MDFRPNGEAELFVPSYNGNMLTGLASFHSESAESWINPDVYSFHPKKFSDHQAGLSLVRLDDCGWQPDFIEIDVQGLEHRVLAGRAETIRTYRPVIMAETIRCGATPYDGCTT